MTLLIPAACLNALGGLIKTDGSVICRNSQGYLTPRHALHGWPIKSKFCAPSKVLVIPSSGTLQQVLARRVNTNMKVEPGVIPRLSPGWAIRGEHGQTEIQGNEWWSIQSTTFHCSTTDCEWPSAAHYIPTLQPSMNRMRALAEIVVWLARVNRAIAKRWKIKTPKSVARCELAHCLTPWEVSE